MNDPMTEAWEIVARWEGGEGRCWFCEQWMPQALFPLNVKTEHPDRWRDFDGATKGQAVERP